MVGLFIDRPMSSLEVTIGAGIQVNQFDILPGLFDGHLKCV
jgi:hypothetical protein